MTGYICTVTAAALVISILVFLAGQGHMGTLVKLVAGIFMALTVLGPVLRLELPDPAGWIGGFESDGTAAAEAGEELADDALRSIIKARTEAYILDKAACFDTSMEVDVVLNGQGIPAAVTLRGDISPHVKMKLSQELAAELGLGEEVQQWISGCSQGG